MRRLGRAPLWAWACAVVFGTAAVEAQGVTLHVPAFASQPDEAQLELDVVPTLVTHGRSGPAGWLTCAVRNPDARARQLRLRIIAWNERVQIVDSMVLQPQEQVTRHYPMFRAGQALSVNAVCDGGPEVRSGPLGGVTAGMTVLLVTPQSTAVGALQSALARLGVGGVEEKHARTVRVRGATVRRAPGVSVVEARPDTLPEVWACFAGFDAVAVDGRGAMTLGSQQALVDATLAGGSLLVLWADSLVDGPLRRALEGRAHGKLGLGRFRVAAAGPDSLLEAETWLLREPGLGVATTPAVRVASGPVPDAMFGALEIAGLGDPPVGAFFVLLTLFVFLAGPLNIYLCRRAGRPLLVAFTLPVLGFGFAAAILLWGVLAEGLGVRGAVRSVTWIDQRNHVVVNHAASTLFAGLTPAALVPTPGTLVTTLAVGDDWRDSWPHRYVLDHAAGGKLGGGLLPARWQTQLVTATCRRARERLRFRRLQEGGLEVLAGPGLLPAAPGLVVRDHAGQCWLGAPDGDRTRLQACALRDAHTFLVEARTSFDAVPEPPARRRGLQVLGAVGHDENRNQVGSLLDLTASIEPGTYVAWVSDNAAFDQLGLEVEWQDARHLVIGVLATEDFVD